MRDGAGPLLAVFLIQATALNSTDLSWVMAAPGLACVCLQAPIGYVFDAARDKRLLLAAAACLLAGSAWALSNFSGFWVLFAAQALVGVTMAILSVVNLPRFSGHAEIEL